MHRTLAVVHAGRFSKTLGGLVEGQATGVLPYAGEWTFLESSIDLAATSGATELWVASPRQSDRVAHLVGDGTQWGFAAAQLFSPEVRGDQLYAPSDEADMLYAGLQRLDEHPADVILTSTASALVNGDLSDVVASHRASGAECTILTAGTDPDIASNWTVVAASPDGVVRAVHYRPESPVTAVVSSGIILFDKQALTLALNAIHDELSGRAERQGVDSVRLGDIGQSLLPRLVARGRTRAVPLHGYWTAINEPRCYLEVHRDVVASPSMGEPRRQTRSSHSPQRPPVVLPRARVEEAMLGSGSLVGGRVTRCVLGRNVTVEPGATVSDSVLHDGTVVRAGAQVRWAIVGEGSEVAAHARVGSNPRRLPADNDDVTILGPGVLVRPGEAVSRGVRVPRGTVV